MAKYKPLYASTEAAIKGVTRELEALAAKHEQPVNELLCEAHTTFNAQPHHTQALRFERMIAHLHRQLSSSMLYLQKV